MVQNQRVQIDLGPAAAVAAGTGDVWFHRFKLPGVWRVVSAHLTPHNAQTADPTNFSTYTLANVTKSTTIGSRAYSATNSVAGTEESILGTTAAHEVAQNDVLSWTKAESGTGLAGHNTVSVVLERIS
jgi:hypothetical protein